MQLDVLAVLRGKPVDRQMVKQYLRADSKQHSFKS